MKNILGLAASFPIRLRVPLSIALAIAIVGAALTGWTEHAHRQDAVAQARAFAESLHQLTLAGLTAMMITGQAGRRDVFLDQIEQSNDVRALRVVRGPAVVAQFGRGSGHEQAEENAERAVIATGQPLFEEREDERGRYLKAVMPVVAQHAYLGKDCLGCHQVADGQVLGAVSVEISLARMQASVAALRGEALLGGLAALALLATLAWMAVSRSVSTPLVRLAGRLRSLALGRIEEGRRLEPHGSDEIAQVEAAFNEVLSKAQQGLRAERIAGDVFEHALEGIVVTDAEGTIIRVNPAFTRTTGYAPGEAVGRNPRMLQSGQHDAGFYRDFWGALHREGQWQGDIWNRRKDGTLYAQWLKISRVCDEHGAVQNYVALFSDVTERKREEALMRHRAHHDALTGLPNRTLFHDRLQHALALAGRRGGRLAVMYLDLDKFKAINDGLGHEMGDELLRQVALRIRAAVRQSDTVARLGGDEFTVLLPEIGEVADARTAGEKILEVTRHPYRLGDLDVIVTTSVGVSIFPEHGGDVETLLKLADTAMYQVKGAGRAACGLYDPGVHAPGIRDGDAALDSPRSSAFR